jgi:hypothetical protein
MACGEVFFDEADKWVPVITAWRVLGLRMEEWTPDMEDRCEYVE